MISQDTHDSIIILDFGSQYTQLIARRIREIGVFSVIMPFNTPIRQISSKRARGIILSGGPSSVYDKEAPRISKHIFDLDIPILGICYGLQLIISIFCGKVAPAAKREYGHAQLLVSASSPLFRNISKKSSVWMSHGDKVVDLTTDFKAIGHTDNSPYAAIQHVSKPIFGLQFHPEVKHTKEGEKILENFCFSICKCTGDWTPGSFIDETINNIHNIVGSKKVICGLSGGVDSSVTAVLLDKAVGKNLHSIFVDTGLLRRNERNIVQDVFMKNFHINLTVVNKTELFLKSLKGISEPEKKRKIIGRLFIEVFEKEANKIGRFDYLAQGTLYPDVIESLSLKGPSATIKSHHNVGGLPKKMKFKLIEPLKELFKDEVRRVGKALGLPDEIVNRHPFPGPGLAVRIPGVINRKKIAILQEADDIYLSELKKHNLYNEIWQAFAVLLPVQSVGVMGDERTYEYTLVLRAVTSTDGMTANWYPMPHNILAEISNKIINEVEGINRVVYDVSSKPPATIEWE
ncbi:GMP synthase [miscellaneous Crenarchaeota group archaeon SMTZ-80]|nr:MAG: GMP synthase [miscellaneous Crenarchaeota group archaeon SMTZ-80]